MGPHSDWDLGGPPEWSRKYVFVYECCLYGKYVNKNTNEGMTRML